VKTETMNITISGCVPSASQLEAVAKLVKLERRRAPLLEGHWITPAGQRYLHGMASAARIRNVRARVAVMKAAVRDYYHDEAVKAQQAIHPGIVLRGWWYPRGLYVAGLVLAWLAVAGGAAWLGWLLFTTPGLV
jgi:hypothetical protein